MRILTGQPRTCTPQQAKIGQRLRENEWLMGIKQRAAMPGGTCEFDLPFYHYWQQQDAGLRRESLQAWLASLLPIHGGLKILLRIIRENNKAYHFIAHHGTFQQMQGGRVAQILRLSLNSELACVPEVSANKYAINIRFTVADYAAKSTLVEHDVPFDLNFHSLLIMPTKAPPIVTCPHCGKEHQWDTSNRFRPFAANAAS